MPFKDIEQGKAYRREYYKQPEAKEQQKQYKLANQEEIKRKKREYYQKHKEEIRKKRREYHNTHKQEEAAQTRAYRESHKNELKLYRSLYHQAYNPLLKLEAVTHYGNGKPVCVKCGYDDIRALSIDHVNGGGAQHRRKLHNYNMYAWLKRNNYPDGFQTLCRNCQAIKQHENKEFNYNGRTPLS